MWRKIPSPEKAAWKYRQPNFRWVEKSHSPLSQYNLNRKQRIRNYPAALNSSHVRPNNFIYRLLMLKYSIVSPHRNYGCNGHLPSHNTSYNFQHLLLSQCHKRNHWAIFSAPFSNTWKWSRKKLFAYICQILALFSMGGCRNNGRCYWDKPMSSLMELVKVFFWSFRPLLLYIQRFSPNRPFSVILDRGGGYYPVEGANIGLDPSLGLIPVGIRYNGFFFNLWRQILSS